MHLSDFQYREARFLCYEMRRFELDERTTLLHGYMEQVSSPIMQEIRRMTTAERIERHFSEGARHAQFVLIREAMNEKQLSDEQKHGIIQSIYNPDFMLEYLRGIIHTLYAQSPDMLRGIPHISKGLVVLRRISRALLEVTVRAEIPPDDVRIYAGLRQVVEQLAEFETDWSVWQAGPRYGFNALTARIADSVCEQGAYNEHERFLLGLCVYNPAFLVGELLTLACMSETGETGKDVALQVTEKLREALDRDEQEDTEEQRPDGLYRPFGSLDLWEDTPNVYPLDKDKSKSRKRNKE